MSFVASFAIARIFTTLSRDTFVRISVFHVYIHVHHYIYGIILLAIGGWLGISYEDDRIVTLAAVLYGVGCGLIADEAGLLLGQSYWTGITYTVVILLLVLIFAIYLLKRYSKLISTEVNSFTKSRVSFYIAVIVAAVSLAFLVRRNRVIDYISLVTTLIACLIIIAYLVQQLFIKRNKTSK
jgi:hypothetical protein